MKPTLVILAVGGLAVLPCASRAGDFVNLGFEDPDLTHLVPLLPEVHPPYGPVGEVLRGWTLTADGKPFAQRVWVTDGPADPVSLEPAWNPPHSALDFGARALWLGWIVPEHFVTYELSQTGTIPADAIGLNYFYDSNGVQVLVDGHAVPQEYSRLSLLGYADVSAYAGKTVELKFVIPGAFGDFDIAGFRQTPEPSVWMLMGLGGGALLWKARRGGRR